MACQTEAGINIHAIAVEAVLARDGLPEVTSQCRSSSSRVLGGSSAEGGSIPESGTDLVTLKAMSVNPSPPQIKLSVDDCFNLHTGRSGGEPIVQIFSQRAALGRVCSSSEVVAGAQVCRVG